MITSAALCPGPPLLVRELTGADPVLPELRAACAEAVATLLRDRPEVVAVVGPGPATGPWPGDGRLNVAAFGGLPAADQCCRPPAATPDGADPDAAALRYPMMQPDAALMTLPRGRRCRPVPASGPTCWTRRVTTGSG